MIEGGKRRILKREGLETNRALKKGIEQIDTTETNPKTTKMRTQTLHKPELFARALRTTVLGVFVLLSAMVVMAERPATAFGSAATNSTINFQARLQTSAGAIAPDGNYNVEFKLYSVSTGGTALWTETYDYNGGAPDNRIRVANGYVSANLGSLTAFSGINWDQNLYLTMNIGGATTTASWDGEMSPRLKVTSVPYAFRAGQLAQLNAASGYTSTLSIAQPTGGDQTFQIQDQGAAGTYNLLTQNQANNSYIQLQGSTPGSVQTGSFNINGTGIADILQGTTAVQTPTLDTASAVALNIGTTNATSINLNQNTTLGSGATFTAHGSGFDTSGKLGVGTTTPGYNLEVRGTTRIVGSDTAILSIANSGSISVLRVDTVNNYLRLSAPANSTAFSTVNNAMPIVFYGNYWNGSSKVSRAFSVQQLLSTTGVDSRLGFMNNAGSEVVTFNDDGTSIFQGQLNGVNGFAYNGTSGATTTCSGGQFLQNQVVQGGIVTGGTCASAAAGLSGSGTDGTIAMFSGSGTNLGDSILTQSGSTVGVAGTLNATTSLQTPILDTASSGTLDIGTTNATTITIGRAGQSLSLPGQVTMNGAGINALTVGGYPAANATQALVQIGSAIAGGDTSLNGGTWLGLNAMSTGYGSAADFLNFQVGGTTKLKVTSAGVIDAAGGYKYNGTAGTSVSCTAGNVLQNATISGGIVTAGSCTANGGGTAGVTLQGSTPGTADVGNFNVTGTGMANILQGTTRVQTALLDTVSSGVLSVGTTNATQINLNKNVVIAASQSLTITGGNTASRPASPSEGTVYYDTTTKQLLTYANGKWQADRSSSTFIVAASNTTNKEKADYVATGTSDQTQINAALSAASSAGGGVVYLTEGTFTVDGSISVPNNVTLVGSGDATLIQLATSGLASTVNAIVNTDTTTGNNVGIMNLKLDGQKAVNSTGSKVGIYISGAGSGTGASAVRGATIQNVTVVNFHSEGIYLNASSNSSVAQSRALGDDYGIYLNSTTYSSVMQSTAQGNVQHGLGLNNSSTNNNLSENLMQYNTNSGITLTNSSTFNVISGNNASHNTNEGIWVSSTDNTIENNLLSYNSGNGLRLNSANQSVATGNKINNNSQYGIYLNSSHVTVSSNKISSNTLYGIYVYVSSYNNIVSNHIYDSSGSTANDGIFVTGTSTYNSISQNYISDVSCTTTCYAINIATGSDNNTLVSNQFYAASGTPTINNGASNTATISQLNSSGQITNSSTSGMVIQGTNAGTYDALQLLNSSGTAVFKVASTGSVDAVSYKAGGTAGVTINCSGNTVIQNATVKWGIVTGGSCVANGGGFTGVTLQASTPGTADTGNFNITGVGIAGTFKASTFDTASAGTLSIGTTNATGISLNQATTITGTTTISKSAANALAVTGAPTNSATLSLVRIGNAISGGNTTASGGTYLGLNAPNSGAGSAADFLNFQKNGIAKLKVTNDGAVDSATGFKVGGTAGATTTCTSGDLLQNAVISGGIVTGGTCAAAGGSGVTTIGALDGGTANADGATISGSAFYLQSASASYAGLVNTGTQSFAGAKTFTGAVNVQGAFTTTYNAANPFNLSNMVKATSCSTFYNYCSLSLSSASNGSYPTNITLNSDTATDYISIDAAGKLDISTQTGVNITSSGTTSGTAGLYVNRSAASATKPVAVFRGGATPGTGADLLQLQNSSSAVLFSVSSSGLVNTTAGYAYNGTAGATTTCSAGNVMKDIVVQGGIVTGGTCVANGGGTTGVTLQATTPGTADTGNFNITGVGIASTFKASTFDTNSAVALNIGTTNASSIQIGSTSGTQNITLGGSGSGNVILGSTGSTAVTMMQGGSAYITMNNSGAYVGNDTDTTTALQVTNHDGSINALTVDTTGTSAVSVANTLTAGGAIMSTLFDTASTAALNIGTTNASTIRIGSTTASQNIYLGGSSGNAVVVVGDTGTSSQTIIGAGNTSMALQNTGLLLQTTGNSATTLVVQKADNTALLTADTTNMQVIVGTTTNGVILSAGGISLAGTAQKTKTIVLNPEYANAVLDPGTGANNTGTMTSGYDYTNRMNYYKWTTTQVSNQSYDIDIQVPIPSDFSSWGSTPMSVSAYTSNTTNGTITVQIIKSNGSADTNFSTFQSATPGSTTTWTTTNFSTFNSSNYTAGDYMTIRIRLQSPTSGDVRVGKIVLNYKNAY